MLGCCRTCSRRARASWSGGQLEDRRRFNATEVLAKHDENYVPREFHDLIEGGDIAGSETLDNPDAG